MDYVDFEITLVENPQGGYSLIATYGDESAAGAFTFNTDGVLLANYLLNVQNAVLVRSATPQATVVSEAAGTLQSLGTTLFDALFIPPVRDLYHASRTRTEQAQQGLRIKLHIQNPALAALPWEYLFDTDGSYQDYVGLSLQSPIIRTFPARDAAPITLPRPLRILGMVAAPTDQNPLDASDEQQRLSAALATLGEDVQLTWVGGGTLDTLKSHLENGTWDIFHYIGHGGFDAAKDEGYLALEAPDGTTKPAYATQLYRLFERAPTLRLAVLNSCDGARHSHADLISAPATALVRQGLPAVIAMQFVIPDAIAKALTTHFYRALAKGHPIEYALADARQSLTFENDEAVEWGVPVLYMRSAAVNTTESLWTRFNRADSTIAWNTVIQLGELLGQQAVLNEQTKEKIARAYYYRSQITYQQSQIEQSLQDMTQAIQLNPQNPWYWEARGMIYSTAANSGHPAGNFALAIGDITYAIGLDSTQHAHYYQRGLVYYNAAYNRHAIGDFAKAMDDFNRALALAPTNALYHQARGLCYYGAKYYQHPLGDYTKALADYDRAIELDPQNGAYYYQRAMTHRTLSHAAESEADFAKAKELGYRW